MASGVQARIALIGKTGAGKSEVSRYLESLGSRRCSTGAVCRSISTILFGDDSKRNTQALDDVLTLIDPSIFLKAALRDLDQAAPLVIDSLRFLSDYDFVRSQGFSVIRVTASEENRKDWLMKRGEKFDFGRDACHRTEIELDEVAVDATIVNDGTKDALLDQVREIVGRL